MVAHGTTVPVPFTPAAGREFVLRQHRRTEHWQGWSLVVEGPEGTGIGAAALMLRPQPGVGGIGYWLLAPARGRGLATRAVRLLSDWALGPCGLDRVEAWVEPDNATSVAVLTRVGFLREGRLRSFLVLGGERTDVEVFSRLRSDPAP